MESIKKPRQHTPRHHGEWGGLVNTGEEFSNKERDISSHSNNSPKKTPGDSNNNGLAWWEPWSLLALCVHEALVSVGQWALEKAQSSLSGVVSNAQQTTSSIYQSVRYRSNTALQECQEAAGLLYMGTFDKLLEGCSRCKRNIELAVLETRLRMQLAINRVQLRTENFGFGVKKKLGLKLNSLQSETPSSAIQSKLRTAKSQTGDYFERYRSVVGEKIRRNVDAVTLKAKEYEDDLEDKFPHIGSGKPKKDHLFLKQVILSGLCVASVYNIVTILN